MSSNQAETIAEMAMQLCGSDFRLHGRSADHGLDCIGLAAQCLAAADIPCEVPTGYSVRACPMIGRCTKAISCWRGPVRCNGI